jgi:hypothetical protein
VPTSAFHGEPHLYNNSLAGVQLDQGRHLRGEICHLQQCNFCVSNLCDFYVARGRFCPAFYQSGDVDLPVTYRVLKSA